MNPRLGLPWSAWRFPISVVLRPMRRAAMARLEMKRSCSAPWRWRVVWAVCWRWHAAFAKRSSTSLITPCLRHHRVVTRSDICRVWWSIATFLSFKDAFLAETLKAFDRRIKVHQVALEDPRQLPHAARAFLLKDDAPGDADLSLYLEDDLVIHDQLFVDKMLWFTEKLNHQYSLMPHRYELTGVMCSQGCLSMGSLTARCFPSTNSPLHRLPRASSGMGRRLHSIAPAIRTVAALP